MGKLTLDPSGIQRQSMADPTLLELETAMLKKELVTGRFIEMQNDSRGLEYTRCMIRYKTKNIVVPVSQMGIDFDKKSQEGYSENEWVRRTQIANAMLGAEVDVIIKAMEEDDFGNMMVIGSRTEAMRKKRSMYFFAERPIFREDIDEIEVRVISTAMQSIRVEVFGVEKIIKMNELSWKWMIDVREQFSVGDVIWVKVKDIKIDRENRTVDMTLSHKDLLPDTASAAIDKLEAGKDCCVGTVTGITEGTYWPIFINLDNDANIVCYGSRIADTAMRGDKVKVAVTFIDYKRKSANGIVVGIIDRNSI